MTRAQYDAIMEIAEYGGRFAPHDLNVPRRTAASLARRGWIAIERGRAIVTPAGWLAVERGRAARPPAGWLAVERDVARDNISK